MAERLAVVTGGSRGIGRAVVRRLASRGDRVLALGRDDAALGEAIGPVSAQADYRICDVTDEEAVIEAISHLPVDILVNNAGIAASAPIETTSLDDWNRIMAVNATGPFLCTRAVLGGMRERDWGRIVMIASVAGHVGARYITAYTASKHAEMGLMRAVAAEVGGSGVTANAVCPAYVDTAMTEQGIANIAAKTSLDRDQAKATLERSSPLGRLIDVEEVAAAVEYLTSAEAAAVNGQSIVIDGGGIQR